MNPAGQNRRSASRYSLNSGYLDRVTGIAGYRSCRVDSILDRAKHAGKSRRVCGSGRHKLAVLVRRCEGHNRCETQVVEVGFPSPDAADPADS